MNRYKNLLLLLVITTALCNCTKQVGPLDDVRPSVSVTVQNASDYRPEPTVTTSKGGGGAIQIVLTIPQNSGRTIKEITKVAASTSYTQIQSTGATGFYKTTPIAGSGTTVTFNTSLTEYTTITKDKVPASNSELPKRFYFLITLDNGSVIVANPVRVLVLD